MRFLHGKIKGYSGEKITVNVSKPTRVLIMPEREFKKYKNNNSFTYFGGHKEGQYEFTIPKPGTWIVVVEKGSYYKPLDLEVSISKEKPPKAEAKKVGKKKKKKKGQEDVQEIAEAAEETSSAEGSSGEEENAE